MFVPFTNPVIVAGYSDVHVNPPTTVVVGSAVETAPPLGLLLDRVVDVVVADRRVVVDERVTVVVDDTVVSTPGSWKPASRAQVPASSPSRQQKPATGAHHVPASQ